jgi:leader peptidase (prepilin peptidase) / N-methyltransferase
MKLPDSWIWIYAALLGAAIGSFLNVCVYRWPADQSVLRPRSRCPGCEQPVRWYDNIPIVSYLVLRGRCRHCSTAISAQYPAVELITCLIWLGAAVRFGATIEALHSALFLTILLGIALTDAKEMVIPDQFSLGGTAIGLLLAAVPGGMSLVAALVGAAAGYAGFWLIKLGAERALKKPALGVGDIHMMAMVGAFTGVEGVFITMLAGSVAGLLIGVPFMWARGKLSVLGTYLPLGVFLAIGAAGAHFYGDVLIQWYLQVVGLA